jgi:acetoin utilization deacetylase AcuC-like enzyme
MSGRTANGAGFVLFHSEVYTGALHPEARFPRMRYRLLREALLEPVASGVLALVEPPRAAREDALLAHDPAYVDAFLEGRLDADAERRIGLRPWTPAIVDRTLAILGGTLAATRLALAGAPATGNAAGGTHHAHRSFGSGYCIFNDIAVGARLALREGVSRVLVIDLDVHQGDGTAAIFADEPRVVTFSMHAEKNFPFRKQASDLDVGLPDGLDDDGYLAALEAHLDAILDAARPELVFYQAGVDALAEDKLGRLNLTREGLRRRNQRVYAALAERGLPVVILMGGGYAEPLARSVEAHADVFLQAAAGPPFWGL